jgi:hypothetical protein
MEYDLEAVSGGVSLRSSGTFQDLHGGQGADLTVRFEGPDIGQVLAHLGQPILSQGAFDFQLDLDTGHVKAPADSDLQPAGAAERTGPRCADGAG